MSPRPFRFGVQSFHAGTGKEWLDRARKIEDLGYSSLFTSDHYFGPGKIVDTIGHPPVDVGPIASIAAAAAVTTTLKVGCRVFCIDYHHPIVLAKEAATIDMISDGRLELGLGAGWVKMEYDSLGIPMDSGGTRIARLEEAVQVIRAHFSGEEIDFSGTHYEVSGFHGLPKPPAGQPPLMIGGGGPKILGVAGRHADIVSINFDNRAGQVGTASIEGSSRERTLQKLSWVREAAGDRWDRIEIETCPYFLSITDDPDSALAAFSSRFDLPPEAFLDNPHVLVGSLERVRDLIIERREIYGFNYLTIPAVHFEAFAPLVDELAGI